MSSRCTMLVDRCSEVLRAEGDEPSAVSAHLRATDSRLNDVLLTESGKLVLVVAADHVTRADVDSAAGYAGNWGLAPVLVVHHPTAVVEPDASASAAEELVELRAIAGCSCGR